MVKRMDGNIQNREIIDQEIANQIFERNRKLIIDQISEMSDMTCNFSRVKMWQVKRKVCPKIEPSYPVAKLNPNGDLVSNRDELKNLYTETYKDRLKHRIIQPNYSKLKELKDNLFEIRLKTSKARNPNHGLKMN